MIFAPPRSAAATSRPRLAKSAERMDGRTSTMTGLLGGKFISWMLRNEPGSIGTGCSQLLLKQLNELRHMFPVDQSVMHMDGYRHGAAAIRLGDLSEGKPGCGVFFRKIARVGDGGEIEPRKHEISNEVLARVPCQSIARLYALQLGRGLANELMQV